MNLLKIALLKLTLLTITINAQTTIKGREQFNTLERSKNYQGKPLEYFLRDLKLEIKSISYLKKNEEGPNQIILRFDNREKYNELRGQGMMPARITIWFYDNHETQYAFKGLQAYGLLKTSSLKQFKRLLIEKIFSNSDQDISK
ncbi:hypothetical protein [Chryseobacterium sp.]|uniref:hypothetical protein n=1 Tax=Chryseobacterium sp. TaxID=1871047 RepID=UPI0028A25BC0|nr:hypothetical protein [Chryseobacterium sp.]